MKKLVFLSLVIFFIISLTLVGFTQNHLKDINTLKVYINNHEYVNERFLHNNGMVYASLDDLSKVLNIQCWVSNDGSGDKVYISYGDHILPFNTGLIKNADSVYVPLTSLCQAIGYELSYNYDANILNIVDPMPVNTVSSNYTNNTVNTLSSMSGNVTTSTNTLNNLSHQVTDTSSNYTAYGYGGNVSSSTYYPLGLPPSYYQNNYCSPYPYSSGAYHDTGYYPGGYYSNNCNSYSNYGYNNYGYNNYGYNNYGYNNCYPNNYRHGYNYRSNGFGISFGKSGVRLNLNFNSGSHNCNHTRW